MTTRIFTTISQDACGDIPVEAYAAFVRQELAMMHPEAHIAIETSTHESGAMPAGVEADTWQEQQAITYAISLLWDRYNARYEPPKEITPMTTPVTLQQLLTPAIAAAADQDIFVAEYVRLKTAQAILPSRSGGYRLIKREQEWVIYDETLTAYPAVDAARLRIFLASCPLRALANEAESVRQGLLR